MVKEALPKQSESQKIGHLACLALKAARPTSWHIKDLEGDDDVGLDKQVQLVEGNKYIALFQIQVKGCRQSKARVNSKLSKDGTFFSESLKISTLNYYARIETPVMLAFADLTADPEPRNCPVYYQWIDEEIDKLLAAHNNLDYLGKKTHTFRIPTKNKLDHNLDASTYLDKRVLIKKATRKIVRAVEEEHPEVEPVLSQLGSRLSSSCILESVLHAPERLWSAAPEGSFAHSLNKVATYLETNRGRIARKELDNLKWRLRAASRPEKAEYYHLKGKLITLIGDYKKARNMFKKAQQLMPKEKKYHLVFVETEANVNYRNPEVCKKLIKEIDGKEGIEYTRLRAKLLALSGQGQEGIALLSKEKEKEVIIVIAVIHILTRNYSKCRDACNKGLKRKGLSIKARLILLCLRARILFIEGMGRDFKGGEIIKFCGIAGMDINILRKCWSDTLEAWDIASNLGYPTDVDYIVDISSVLSTYFADTNLIFYHLKELAKIRTSSHEVQEALFIMAIHLDDKDVVKEQIKRLPRNPAAITAEIMFYYKEGERGQALDIILDNIEKLEEAKGENYDTILLVGAECANEQLKSEELSSLLSKIKSLPNSNDIQACYRFYEAINQNPLNKKKAVNELHDAFASGCKDKQIQAQLLMHLNVHQKHDAKKILNVVAETIKERHLLEREIIRVCEARITLEQWEEAITLLDSAHERFGETNVFLTLRALVLDASGDTPNALKILDKIIESGNFEPRIAEITAQIAGRCGLANKAKKLYEQLLSQESEAKRKPALLRMLFLLEMRIDPESPQLRGYCDRYGELCNTENETEEGMYLQMVLAATTAGMEKPTDEARKSFQKRLNVFVRRFPDSKFVKAVHYKPGAPVEKFLKQLEEVTGMTPETRKWYQRNENLMRSGSLPVPFAVRAKYLLNVCDFLHLWELSKRVSKDDSQYHLVMALGPYEYVDLNKLKGRVPLLDEVSLFVLSDLDILGKVFTIFPKIAVPKSTLSRIQNWGQSIFVSGFSQKAKKVSDILLTALSGVFQPSCAYTSLISVDFGDLDGYRTLVNEGDFLFYTDCAFTRLYVCGEEQNNSMTTLDVIKILRDRGGIDRLEGAKLIGRLSEWNVVGVTIKYIDDILTVIAPDLTEDESIESASKKMNENPHFNALVSGIWHFRKDYPASLAEIGQFIAIMVAEREGLRVDRNIIAAIWYKWFEKICLALRGEQKKLHYFARSFASAGVQLGTSIGNKPDNSNFSSRLWSIYRDVVQFAFGNEMNEEIEQEMLVLAAELISEIDSSARDITYNFLSEGLVDDTKDSQRFRQAYLNARLKQVKRTRGN